MESFPILTTQQLAMAPTAISQPDSPSGTFAAHRLDITDTTPFIAGGKARLEEGATSEEPIVIQVLNGTQLVVEQLANTFTSNAQVTSLGRTNPGDPTSTTLVKNATGVRVNGSKNKAEVYFNTMLKDIKKLWANSVDTNDGKINNTQVEINANAGSGSAGDKNLLFRVTDTVYKKLFWNNTASRMQFVDQSASLIPVQVGTPTASSDAVPLGFLGYQAVRQTVLTGSVDTSGLSNFIGVGSGLQPQLTASGGNPVTPSFAAGFNSNGPIDFISVLTANQSWPSLPASNNSFLYADFASSSTVILGSTLVPPVYRSYWPKGEHALLHFNGTNGSTSFIDEFGHTWTASGGAQVSTTSPKFGTGCYLGNGTNSDVHTNDILTLGLDSWTMECWVNFTALPASGTTATVMAATNTSFFGATLYLYNNSGVTKLTMDLSGDGSTNNIASISTGTQTSWSTGTYYHIALVRDFIAGNYKTYINGVLDATVSSSIHICPIAAMTLGNSYPGRSSVLNGRIDEFRFTKGCARYTAAFTPTASEFSQDALWFDLSTYKMKTGGPGVTGWMPVNRVVMGEAYAGPSSISTVTAYSLQGRFDTGWFSPAIGNTTKNHNLGTMPLRTKGFIQTYQNTIVESESIYNGSANPYLQTIFGHTRLLATYKNSQGYTQFYSAGDATTAYLARMILDRGW